MNRSNYLKIIAFLLLAKIIDPQLAEAMVKDEEVVCMTLDGACSWLVDCLGIQVPSTGVEILPVEQMVDGPSRHSGTDIDDPTPPLWMLLAYQRWHLMKQGKS